MCDTGGLFGKTEHVCVFTAPSLWMNLCEVNMSDDGGLFSGAADRERTVEPSSPGCCTELVHAK